MSARLAVAALALAPVLPVVAGAQAYSCTAPAVLPPIHPEGADARNPQRLLPIGGYTLAVSWIPEYCHGHLGDPAAGFECGGSGASFGFALHGLWPDGIGPEWPQYCKAATLLPPATIRRNICATPSAQLLQHEWSKHGTCTGLTPDGYFARSTGLFGRLRFPDMAAFGRGTTTAGAVAQAIAAANPGVSPDMMRITASRDGWLDEVWFCLDRKLAYTRCKPGGGGVAPGTSLRVARRRDASASYEAGRYRRDRYQAGRYRSDRY